MVIAHQGNQPPDVVRCQLVWPQADDAPTGERGFEVFLQIGGETRTAVVATVHVDAALDLDQGLGFKIKWAQRFPTPIALPPIHHGTDRRV